MRTREKFIMKKFRALFLPAYGMLSLVFLLLAGCISTPTLHAPPQHYVTSANAEGRKLITPDGLTLFGQWWLPAKEPRAVILLVHGTALHSGFYTPWAEHLTKQGYAVFGIDLRGWGQSQGRGRRGYVRNYDEYLNDVRVAYREINTRFPKAPVFLQGESLGGAVVLLSAIWQTVPADGLILNAPAVKPSPGLGFLRAPGFLAGFGLWGAGMAAQLAPNAPAIPFIDTFTDFAFDSDKVRQRFIKDPLCTHNALPAAYIAALSDATKRIQDGLGNVKIPVIVLHGTADTLIPLSSSEFVMEKVGSTDKMLKVYEGMFHTTLHDTGRDAVWSDITGWLGATIRYQQEDRAKAAAALAQSS